MMKSVAKIWSRLAILSCAVALGCSSTSEPGLPLVDPALIGEWAHVDTDTPTRPANHGIRIQQDGTLGWLAVETSTGILRSFEGRQPARIIEARSGKLIFEIRHVVLGREESRRYEVAYNVSDSGLEFDRASPRTRALLAESYRKSATGKQVTEPITSHFEMTMDGGRFENETFTNVDLWMGPSAFAHLSVYEPKDYFVIVASDGGCVTVSIVLRDIDGPGVYVLEGETGWIQHVCFWGDAIYFNRTDYTERAGEVIIESFDAETKTYTGTFAAALKFRPDEVVIVDGRFEVPFFEATLD